MEQKTEGDQMKKAKLFWGVSRLIQAPPHSIMS